VNWRQIPLGYCVTEVKKKNAGGREENLLSLSYGNIVRRDIATADGLLPESFDSYNVINPGDTVLRLTDLQNDQRSLRVGLVEEVGIITSAYVTIRPSKVIQPKFLNYFLKHMDFRKDFYALGAGVRQSLKFDELRSVKVPVPALADQKVITDFLDRETMLIDSLVERKLKLVEVLRERQAEFERSVVAGLLGGSDRRMTGNSLIPNIPNNWKLIRTRFLCSIDTGSSDTDESEDVGMYPFFVRSQTPNLSNRFIFDTEAVLTAGDGAGVGKVFHHFEGKFDAHQRVYVMHNFKGISGRFFFYFFSSFFGIAALDGSAKSTVDSVRRHMISELPVAVPPLEEQVRLTRILDDSRKKMELTSTLLRQQVIRLRERREALISAAVTGQLEISEVAA
jgi:type I restriction enzyme S subunit